MIGRYDWAGGSEMLVHFGPDQGPVVVVAMPLLEEANRTRTFVAGMLRRLGNLGIGGVLADLPGQNESLTETARVTLADWRIAYAAACAAMGERPVYGLAIRGGALLDHEARLRGRWRLAPQSGDALIREWRRVTRTNRADAPDDGMTIAGNRLSRTLLDALSGALPYGEGVTRTVRLATDPAPADRVVAGPPLWRWPEPGDDPDLAALLARDIADWIATCGE